MDGRTFDLIARAFGAAATRRAALSGLIGLALGTGASPLAAEADAERRRRRNRCRPECPPGQQCKRTACVCVNGGSVCGAECCVAGQACQDGRCVSEPTPCIPAGEPCKDTGRICCGDRTCASGQGGQADIACYAPAGAACATTADCVYGAECVDGACRATPGGCPGATVCASGCPFTTIEAALAAAAPGSVVTVAPGTYAPVPKLVDDRYVYLHVKDVALAACDPARPVEVLIEYDDRAYRSRSGARGFSNPIAALLETVDPIGSPLLSGINLTLAPNWPVNPFAPDEPRFISAITILPPLSFGPVPLLSNVLLSGAFSQFISCFESISPVDVLFGPGIVFNGTYPGALGILAPENVSVLCVSRVRFGPYAPPCEGSTIAPSCGCTEPPPP